MAGWSVDRLIGWLVRLFSSFSCPWLGSRSPVQTPLSVYILPAISDISRTLNTRAINSTWTIFGSMEASDRATSYGWSAIIRTIHELLVHKDRSNGCFYFKKWLMCRRKLDRHWRFTTISCIGYRWQWSLRQSSDETKFDNIVWWNNIIKVTFLVKRIKILSL